MECITELFDLFGESIFCSICQDDCKEGERIRSFYECEHSYHSKCIEQWFSEKHTCPTCRKEFKIPKEIKITYDNVNDLERLYLTWTCIHGILKKMNNAIKFNEKKNELRNNLTQFRYESYKLLPLDLDSRYSLCSMKQYIATKIARIASIDKNSIHRQPNVFIWIDRIESSSILSPYVIF
jgi:hypothetical protein|uniref:RING-type domain-containing protein n=1 Tax=viral metagenome TaxID=1070528 RepID=A0A6C0IFR2_9ZZZZ